MEPLVIHPNSESQSKLLKQLLKELKIQFEKLSETKSSAKKPNAETIKAIEEGRKERHKLQPITDIDAFFEEFKNE